MNFSDKDEKRFWEKVDIKGDDECWNWTARLDILGYGHFYLNGKNERVHRCSLVLAHTTQPHNKQYALHTCKQNRKCCNPNHLYWGDQLDNMNDLINDNTHGLSKLTDIQVREIRQKYVPYKYSQQKLANEYGVAQTLISSIILNKIWKHVQ